MNADADFETHRLNYRIAFDAMRAYHVSEIEHKKDMITILNAILISIVSVYAGVFYFILSKDFNAYNKLALIVTPMIAILYFILINKLKSSNITKLEKDSDRYKKFRTECQLERDYLGLSMYFQKRDAAVYWNETAAEQHEHSGYDKTVSIINIYSDMLKWIVSCLMLIAVAMLLLKINALS